MFPANGRQWGGRQWGAMRGWAREGDLGFVAKVTTTITANCRFLRNLLWAAIPRLFHIFCGFLPVLVARKIACAVLNTYRKFTTSAAPAPNFQAYF